MTKMAVKEIAFIMKHRGALNFFSVLAIICKKDSS